MLLLPLLNLHSVLPHASEAAWLLRPVRRKGRQRLQMQQQAAPLRAAAAASQPRRHLHRGLGFSQARRWVSQTLYDVGSAVYGLVEAKRRGRGLGSPALRVRA